jgi:hypothetical protein
LAVADPVAGVADVAPPVALAVLPGLPVVLLLPVAGLVGEPDDVGDGVAGGVVGVVAGLGEPDFTVGEGDADDSGHDEIGVGRWCLAAVVCDPAVAWP